MSSQIFDSKGDPIGTGSTLNLTQGVRFAEGLWGNSVGSALPAIAKVELSFNSEIATRFAIDNLTFSPDAPPTISGTPSATVEICGVTDGVVSYCEYAFTPTVDDPEGSPLTCSLMNAPQWLSVDPDSCEVSGTPSASDIGITKDIEICVTDGINTTCLPSFNIGVDSVNRAPGFNKGSDQSICTNAGGQIVYNWATNIRDGNLGTQQYEFIATSNSNPNLFGGLLGFGGQPYVFPNGTLSYRGALNTSGQATVCIQLKDNGGAAFGGSDTSAEQCFNIHIDPNCDDGAGEIFNSGQFDFDPAGNAGIADLSLLIADGFVGNDDWLQHASNIPLDGLDSIGDIKIPLIGIGVQSQPLPSEVPNEVPLVVVITNQSSTAGRNVEVTIDLDNGQKFLKADRRCAIDAAVGLANCYLNAVPQGETQLTFGVSVTEGQEATAAVTLKAANDSEFRDNTVVLGSSPSADDPGQHGSNGGGSFGWMSLMALIALRRRYFR